MKFVGKIGFWEEDQEISPGVYKPMIIERTYVGDVLRDNRRFKPNSTQNEEFTISNRISIIADLYTQTNWGSIRYVEWRNQKIKVINVDIDYPRIVLELGGMWNGEIET